MFLWANESYHLEQYTEVLWRSKASSGNLMGEPYKSVSNSLQLHLQYETAVYKSLSNCGGHKIWASSGELKLEKNKSVQKCASK